MPGGTEVAPLEPGVVDVILAVTSGNRFPWSDHFFLVAACASVFDLEL